MPEKPFTEKLSGTCRLHVDGASRGNPGPAAGAAVLYDADGKEAWSGAKTLGVTTNNVAEYEALIMGLEAALARCDGLVVAADSELVVKQLAGHYKVKQEHLAPLVARARELLSGFRSVEVVHVRRTENARADELANAALDGAADESPPGGVYQLSVKSHFDAAHSLRGYPGKCKELHGHTWDVEMTVSGRALNDIGILYDFGDLKDLLEDVLGPLDHHNLNEVPPFDKLSPTGENLARYVFDRLEAKLGREVCLVEVVVWESPVARLAYRR